MRNSCQSKYSMGPKRIRPLSLLHQVLKVIHRCLRATDFCHTLEVKAVLRYVFILLLSQVESREIKWTFMKFNTHVYTVHFHLRKVIILSATTLSLFLMVFITKLKDSIESREMKGNSLCYYPLSATCGHSGCSSADVTWAVSQTAPSCDYNVLIKSGIL